MRFISHGARLLVEVVRFGFASHRLSFVLVVVLGAALALIAVLTQAAVPFVFYPFA